MLPHLKLRIKLQMLCVSQLLPSAHIQWESAIRIGILLATNHFTNWSTNKMPSRNQFNSCWDSDISETNNDNCLQDLKAKWCQTHSQKYRIKCKQMKITNFHSVRTCSWSYPDHKKFCLLWDILYRVDELLNPSQIKVLLLACPSY